MIIINFKRHQVAVPLLTGKICSVSDSFKELSPDDCTCSLTEQNIVINDHNDAMIQ